MGRPPSLASWWRCCQCSREVNPAQYGDGCPDCGHESCLYYCTRYGGGGGGGGSGGSSWGNLPSATTSAQPPASTREPTKVSPADSSKHPTEASSSSSTTKGAQRLLKPKIALFDEEEPWPKIEKGPRSRHRRSTEKDTDVSAQLDPQLVGGTLVEGSDSDYADDESVSLPPKARTPKPLELPFHHSSDGIGSGINSATSNASLFVGCYTWIGSFLHAPPKPGLTRVTWKCVSIHLISPKRAGSDPMTRLAGQICMTIMRNWRRGQLTSSKKS